MQAYRQTAREFAIWAAAKGINKTSKLTAEIAARYLKEREDSGKSSYTVSKDMAAINKIFGYSLTKKAVGLKNRSLKDVTRSRKVVSNDKRNVTAFKDQILFAKATGCRRMSVCKVRPSDCQRNATGKVVAVMLTENGGKLRVAPVLNEYKEMITQVVEAHTDGDKPLFDTYDTHIDNHAFRGEYAAALLAQLEAERKGCTELCGGDYDAKSLVNLRGKDAASNAPYRGHDRDICGMVSGALGHNRLCIVFQSYIN